MKNRFVIFTVMAVVCLAGFSGCFKHTDKEDAYADYKMTGTLVSAETGEPVQGMVVTVTKVVGNRQPFMVPSTTTSKSGKFTLIVNGFYCNPITFTLALKNPTDPEEGTVLYEEVQRDVPFQNVSFADPVGDFYAGMATRDLKEITLTPLE